MAYCDRKKNAISLLGTEKSHFLFILGRMCRSHRHGQKWPKNDQNDVKIENFQIFRNGPKWIKVASKWSKMAPKPIFGPFGHVFVPFWPVPPSLWGVSPAGWAGLGPPGIRLGGTLLEPIFVACGHRPRTALGRCLHGWPQCCSNGF